MRGWIQDARIALRGFRRKPTFLAASLMTLALGFGGVTAVSSVVNTLLLKPLPYPDPDRLLFLRQQIPQAGRRIPFPPYLFERLDRSARGVLSVAAFDRVHFNLSGEEGPERIAAAQVSRSFFRLLGVDPAWGRGFRAEEEQPGTNRVALISHGFWQTRFGGSPDVLGRELQGDGTFAFGPDRSIPDRLSVVGVLPASFRPPLGNIDIWIPFVPNREDGPSRFPFLAVFARLDPRMPVEQARAELAASYQSMPFDDYLPKEGRTLDPVSLPEIYVRDIRSALLLLWVSSGVVLLIGCGNVANLLLVRGSGRESEMAMRVVVGADRFRLVRFLLTESLMLAGLGSALGLGLASAAIALIRAHGPEHLPRLAEIHIEPKVFLFTLCLSLFSVVFFGLLPALRASRPDLGRMLQAGSRGASPGRGRMRLRGLLVASEIALCLALLIAACLVIESLYHLEKVDPGYRPENVLSLQVQLPPSRYPERSRQESVVRSLLERFAAVGGVESVGAVSILPMAGLNMAARYRVGGRESRGEGTLRASFRYVSPFYLETLGVPLVLGRYLDGGDFADPPRTVLVNKKMAAEVWPGVSPLGERLVLERFGWPGLEVVGVVGDVRYRGLGEDDEPAMYIPRIPCPSASFVVRTRTEPQSIGDLLRYETAAVDPRLPAFDVMTLEERLDDHLAQDRFHSILMSVFAFIALAMAVIGIYGVMSYAVDYRRHEIGIRMALGAESGDVVRMVLRQSAVLTLAGTALGLLVASLSTRLMENMLFGVSSTDPGVFVLAPVALILVGLTAAWIPAKRAACVSPQTTLVGRLRE